MTALEAALTYARRGWPVFPCQWLGPNRKGPLTSHGFHDASTDPVIITAWWRRWPLALIGIPTGLASRFVVLDVDVKRLGANGFDTLADLAFAVLPDTPIVHTASGGLHIYFEPPAHTEIRNTAGARGLGIGPGLDWRGDGGYAIMPSPGSAYCWDPHWNFETVALAPVPPALLPRAPQRPSATRPVRPATGLSPYAEAALDKACRRILNAPAGEQEVSLNAECFGIGRLAGAGAIPPVFAQMVLIWAARQIPDYDPHQSWGARQIETKVNRAFDAGMRRPRNVRHA